MEGGCLRVYGPYVSASLLNFLQHTHWIHPEPISLPGSLSSQGKAQSHTHEGQETVNRWVSQLFQCFWHQVAVYFWSSQESVLEHLACSGWDRPFCQPKFSGSWQQTFIFPSLRLCCGFGQFSKAATRCAVTQRSRLLQSPYSDISTWVSCDPQSQEMSVWRTHAYFSMFWPRSDPSLLIVVHRPEQSDTQT